MVRTAISVLSLVVWSNQVFATISEAPLAEVHTREQRNGVLGIYFNPQDPVSRLAAIWWTRFFEKFPTVRPLPIAPSLSSTPSNKATSVKDEATTTVPPEATSKPQIVVWAPNMYPPYYPPQHFQPFPPSHGVPGGQVIYPVGPQLPHQPTQYPHSPNQPPPQPGPYPNQGFQNVPAGHQTFPQQNQYPIQGTGQQQPQSSQPGQSSLGSQTGTNPTQTGGIGSGSQAQFQPGQFPPPQGYPQIPAGQNQVSQQQYPNAQPPFPNYPAFPAQQSSPQQQQQNQPHGQMHQQHFASSSHHHSFQQNSGVQQPGGEIPNPGGKPSGFQNPQISGQPNPTGSQLPNLGQLNPAISNQIPPQPPLPAPQPPRPPQLPNAPFVGPPQQAQPGISVPNAGRPPSRELPDLRTGDDTGHGMEQDENLAGTTTVLPHPATPQRGPEPGQSEYPEDVGLQSPSREGDNLYGNVTSATKVEEKGKPKVQIMPLPSMLLVFPVRSGNITGSLMVQPSADSLNKVVSHYENCKYRSNGTGCASADIGNIST